MKSIPPEHDNTPTAIPNTLFTFSDCYYSELPLVETSSFVFYDILFKQIVLLIDHKCITFLISKLLSFFSAPPALEELPSIFSSSCPESPAYGSSFLFLFCAHQIAL